MGYVSGMAERTRSDHELTRLSAMLTQSRRMKELIGRLITLARLERREYAAEQEMKRIFALRFAQSSTTRSNMHQAARSTCR